jgi:hypothetical protein
MFKETEEGQTHFCEACEQEGKVLPITSEHTCGLNKPSKK